MVLHEFANQVNLEHDNTQILNVGNCCFQYIKGDKKVRNIKNPWISRYYLVALEDSNIKLLNYLDGFYQFQKTLLADTFFDIKNDIRWNIYLIFLINNSYRVLDKVPIWDIENDDNYARKYFFTYSDCLEFFHRDNFDKSNNSVLPSNPSKEWFDILKSVDLTGVLTGNFLKNNIYNFLDGAPFLTTEIMAPEKLETAIVYDSTKISNKDKKHIVENIRKVTLGNFRKHCFGESQIFNPALVNLVHGSNGCGKTSILEAVEFALTGEIKRLKDFNEKLESQPIVSVDVTTKAGNVVYKSNESLNKNKEFDRIWYGTPSGREKSTLNYNFNHFNSFNSETGYKFALEESLGQNDYSQKFSRLIYDDDILSMEKLWTKYREFIKEELDRRKDIFEKKNVEAKLIQKEINELKQISSSTSFNELLKAIKYRLKVTEEDTFEKQENIYISLQTLKPVISNFMSIWNEYEFKFISQLRRELNQTHLNVTSIGNELQNKSSVKNDLEKEKDFCFQQINDLEVVKAENEAQLKKVINSLVRWQNYKVVLSNSEKVSDYQSLLINERLIVGKKYFLATTIAKYPNILEFSESDVKPLNNDEFDSIMGQLALKQREKESIEEQINITSSSIKEIKKLKIQINNIGIRLINLMDKKNICPLCGSTHLDKEELIKTITKDKDSATNEEKLIAELDNKRTNLIKEIDALNIRLQEDAKRRQNLDLIVKVAKDISNSGYYSLVYNTSDNSLLTQLRHIISSINTLTNGYNQLASSIKAYESEGFSNDAIAAASIFKEKDQYYKKYLLEDKEVVSFEHYIANIRQDLISLIDESTLNAENLNSRIKAICVKISTISIEEKQKELTAVKNRLEILKKLYNDYNNLNSYFELTDNDNILDWLRTIEETFLKIDIAIAQVRALKNLNERQIYFEKLTKHIKELETQILRGKSALEKFNSLKSLNDYSIQFIKSNIKRIEYFFKALHTPREFRSLDVNSEGVYAIRERNNEIVRMHQMSTGQRVSLALAIMFSLYIAAPRAPKLLLLDEPVANMDDLHLLNLIDILREFALRRTQVIFTTSNPNVAGLFRRKFSFFGSEFRHYELVRKNDESTEVIILEFAPDSEEAKVLSSIS